LPASRRSTSGGAEGATAGPGEDVGATTITSASRVAMFPGFVDRLQATPAIEAVGKIPIATR
jgi:hypothetical protein